MLQLLFSGAAEVAAGLSNSKGCPVFSCGPDGFPGHLRGAPGGTLETFWELLGSSGSTFWEHFLNEKQFFAISNRKMYAKRVST